MGFWRWLNNDKPPVADNPGDPEGLQVALAETSSRSLLLAMPSPWNGWPSDWWTPDFQTQFGLTRLIDIAWAAIDKNASILASLPVYRLRNGEILPSLSWQTNPDPDVYSSWDEFFKQVVWDYLACGEAFILAMAHGADGYPLRFRVVPVWLINVEMVRGSRQYFLGGSDVTDRILHIRYKSTNDDAHGHSPLECAGARITAAGLLQKYGTELAKTGGVPNYWIEVERRLTQSEADDIIGQWVASRAKHSAHPAIISGKSAVHQAATMNAKDMALLELSQFNEARICVLLGVPPFLLGLPSVIGESSITYQNIENVFTFHDRSSLRPFASAVMKALSNFLLPRGQNLEINRDEYTRPGFKERAEGWKAFWETGAITGEGVAQAERFTSDTAPAALTGVQLTNPSPPATPTPAAQPATQNQGTQ